MNVDVTGILPNRRGCKVDPHALQQRIDTATIRADSLGPPVNHELRRVDLASENFRIAPLPLGRGARGKRILPAESVPIIDMEREREDVRSLGELPEDRVRRRA